jgi:hypothetical protein
VSQYFSCTFASNTLCIITAPTLAADASYGTFCIQDSD